ncbi:hypothetical protein LCGC14_0838660 [marine sediment metagenome]|uniref:ATP-grasp domain-containing protein n=1 Tax=marine sediment metagenome TaxID=412755 RepID=A0A0F9PZ19_9ZZZZ
MIRALKNLILRHFRVPTWRRALWLAHDEYRDIEQESSNRSRAPYTIGIVKEYFNCHGPYVGACRDVGVAYKVVDISGSDWQDVVLQSGCDAFLVWPSAYVSVWKQMYDERLRIMTEELQKRIYPSYKGLWIYESKRRMHYWLTAHDIARPTTWVLYDLEHALEFARTTPLPIVFKSDLGSGASGVRVFRSRRAVMKCVRKCFRKGFLRTRGYPLDRQWGNLLFQEYIPGAKEWRMVRIGNSYFGHQKGQIGEFHSGTDIVLFAEPPEELLTLVREVTELGGFESMNVDVFETSDGRYLVNELQAVFGPDPEQMRVDGKCGRYVYEREGEGWRFEEGVFWQNNCCNLRVEHLVNILDEERSKQGRKGLR